MIVRVLLPWMACALFQTVVAQQGGPEGKAFLPPAGGALWQHKETGLAFPGNLGDMNLEDGFEYQASALGVSLRYVNAKLRARADVYVYPCARPHGDGDEIKKSLMEEAGAVLGELELMRERGRYAAIQHEKSTLKEVKLHEGGESAWLEMPIHLTINEDRGAGVAPTRVESLLGLSVYRGFWVKVRYTFPAETGPEGMESREEFVKQLSKCVLAADLRKELKQWIAIYRKDPLSAEAVDKGGGVVAFVDALPLVRITLGPAILEFGEACEKQQAPNATQHVMRALIVGVTDATMLGRTHAEAVAAGVREVSVLCDAWRKRDPKFAPPSLDEFGAAVAKDNKVEPASPKTGATQGNKAKKTRS